jgi:hypothetical protein
MLFLQRPDPCICGITLTTNRTFHIRLVSANTMIRDRFQIPQPECPSRPFSSQIPLNNQVSSLINRHLVYSRYAVISLGRTLYQPSPPTDFQLVYGGDRATQLGRPSPGYAPHAVLSPRLPVCTLRAQEATVRPGEQLERASSHPKA